MSELDQFDHADEPENIRLLDNESLSIVVKKHPTTHQELVALLCETAATTRDFMLEKIKEQQKQKFREGYERGLQAVRLILGTPPLFRISLTFM
jgi:hypothetical protein